MRGQRCGYLKEELDYFLTCVLAGETPSVIAPQESRDVVHVVFMTERSARENRLIEFAP